MFEIAGGIIIAALVLVALAVGGSIYNVGDIAESRPLKAAGCTVIAAVAAFVLFVIF